MIGSMAVSIGSSFPSISALFPSNPPKHTWNCTLGHPYTETVPERQQFKNKLFSSSCNIGAVCCHSPLASKQSNSFTSIHIGARRLQNPLWHHPFSLKSIPGEPTPQLQNSHLHLRRSSQIKSGEAEWNLSSEGVILDEQTLQQNLHMAIKEENYALAAKLRDDLRVLHEDSKASVLAANARFYHAFRNGDLVAMQSIWAKGDNIYCIHPGAGAISGYALVMDSWEFVCGADHEFPLQIELKNVEVYIRGDIGYVTCLEVVKTKGSSWGKQVATNVFERVEGQWFLCIHHASHVDL